MKLCDVEPIIRTTVSAVIMLIVFGSELVTIGQVSLFIWVRLSGIPETLYVIHELLEGEIQMGRYIKNFDEITILKVIKAYLVDGLSHRKIQREILDIPAPDNGGGYIAMDILHHYGILGIHKSILSDNNFEDAIDEYTNIKTVLVLLEEYIELEKEAQKKIENKDFVVDSKTTVVKRETKIRINQDALRKRILESYSHECAICNINKDDLLICSHIKPWSIDEENRLNPSNAICLCVLHDKLFDRGYFGFDKDYNIVICNKSDKIISDMLTGLRFKKPIRDIPDKKFLLYHLQEICK